MDKQDTSSTCALPDKETLKDLSRKELDSMFDRKFLGVGFLGRWLSLILDKKFPREVRDDWLRVAAMHQLIVERIYSDAEANPKDNPIMPETLEALTISRDCLCFAKETHLLEEAWRYVNQASETLSRVANPKECAELTERFLEWECSAPR